MAAMSGHERGDSKTGRRSKWDIPADQRGQSNAMSATDAARERAAKLNAMLAAKGKLAKEAPPPPMMVQATVKQLSVPLVSAVNFQKEAATQDQFMEEVEVNDSPARTILCRGTTQDEINRYSGAAVSTRGRYMSEKDKREAEQSESGDRPLYLCIQSSSQQKVDLAVKRVREILSGADIYGKPPSHQLLPQTFGLPVGNTMRPPPVFENNSLPPGMHYVQDKVFVGLDHATPDFGAKDKLVGPNGSYFEHIARETGAKVQLRGKGSGFIEPTSGREAFEALYIYISHNKVDGLAAAKKLVESLLQTVHTEFQAFDQMKRTQYSAYPPHSGGYPAHGGYPPPYQAQGYGYPPPVGAPHPPRFGPPGPPTTAPYFHQPPPSSQPVGPPGHHPPPHPPQFRGQAPPGVPYGYPQYGPPLGVLPPGGPPLGVLPPGGPPPSGPPPSGPSPGGPPLSGPPPGAPAGPYPRPMYPNTAYPVALLPGGPPTRPPGGPPPGPGQPPHLPPTGQPPPLMAPPVQPPVTQGLPTSSAPTSDMSSAPRDRVPLTAAQEQSRRRFTEKVSGKMPLTTEADVPFYQQSSVSPHSQEHSQVKAPAVQAPSSVGPGAKESKKPESQSETRFRPPVLSPPKLKPDKIKIVMPPPSSISGLIMSGRKHGLPESGHQKEGEVKKQKTEESPQTRSSAIASLAAYGEGDSSDEESSSPDDKKDSRFSANGRSSTEKQNRPFWAVRH